MAAPAPVNVHIPAGPAPAEAPLHIDANDALVASLPWLPWDPAPAGIAYQYEVVPIVETRTVGGAQSLPESYKVWQPCHLPVARLDLHPDCS